MAGEILYCFNIYTSKEQVGNIGMTEDVMSDLKINGINAVAMLRLLTQFGFDFEGSFDPVDNILFLLPAAWKRDPKDA